MYCSKCGTKLNEGDLFCPKCGNSVSIEEKMTEKITAEEKGLSEKKTDIANMRCEDEMGVGQKTATEKKSEEETVKECSASQREKAETESDISQDMKDAKAKSETDTEKADQDAQEQKNQGFSKFWNSPVFNKAAEKFGNILTVIEGVAFLILARLLFSEGGFWGIAFGILFLLAGIAGVVGGIKDLISRTKKELTEKELNKAKRNMCIGVPIIIIALWILLSTGGGVYSNVQAITFDSYGSETIGEIVDNNLKSPKWSKDKIDSTSCKVYVKGYSKLYDEDVRITFYYEEDGGSYEVTLQSVELLDSGETYSDMFSLALIWATFY